MFVDASFIVALVNKHDEYHEQAVELGVRYIGEPLLVTQAVLLEIGNALSRRYKRDAVEVIENLLSSQEVEVVPLTPRLFERAFDLYRAYEDKEWGLVDCISFVVMRDAGISAALTSDHHFSHAGFQALLRAEDDS